MTRLHVPVPIRWADLDAYGHVNNAAMLTLLEESRIAVFWGGGDLGVDGLEHAPDAAASDGAGVGGTAPGTATATLVARQEVEYLAPIPYLRAPLDVHLWIGRLGGASLDVCYEVWSPLDESEPTLYAKAATTIVLVDAESGRPRRITERERSVWGEYVEDPIAFKS